MTPPTDKYDPWRLTLCQLRYVLQLVTFNPCVHPQYVIHTPHYYRSPKKLFGAVLLQVSRRNKHAYPVANKLLYLV